MLKSRRLNNKGGYTYCNFVDLFQLLIINFFTLANSIADSVFLKQTEFCC